MITASMAGIASSGAGTGCSRRGPIARDGEQRSLHTGSASTRYPSTSITADEWPYQVTARSPAVTLGSGVTSGTGPAGRCSAALPMTSRTSRNCSWRVRLTGLAGSRLTNAP
jgi:hypothetical protein